MVQGYGRAGQIIKQRLQSFVEQRQPVLHARHFSARGNSFVEGVFPATGAEKITVAVAESFYGGGIESAFTRRLKGDLLALSRSQLGHGIEDPDAFKVVAK